MNLKIGITIGDVGGVGPEIIIKALGQVARTIEGVRFLIFAPREVFERFKGKSWAANFFSLIDAFEIVPIEFEEPLPVPGEESESGGKLSYLSIERAVRFALSGEIQGVVTAPVSKYAINKAGLKFVGQTELLANMCGVEEVVMFFVGENLKVGLLTTHLPLREVAGALSKEVIVRKILLVDDFLRKRFGIRCARFALLGLNPHSGEGGVIGDEEEKVFLPALEHLSTKGVCIEGPFPADSFFARERYRAYDAIISPYHDQGLVAFKILERSGVNTTIGLPFVRTSPDHGTAFDIAPQFIADPESMISAIALACGLCRAQPFEPEIV